MRLNSAGVVRSCSQTPVRSALRPPHAAPSRRDPAYRPSAEASPAASSLAIARARQRAGEQRQRAGPGTSFLDNPRVDSMQLPGGLQPGLPPHVEIYIDILGPWRKGKSFLTRRL